MHCGDSISISNHATYNNLYVSIAGLLIGFVQLISSLIVTVVVNSVELSVLLLIIVKKT